MYKRQQIHDLLYALDPEGSPIPERNIRGQVKSDWSGIATPQEAAFWSAQMRVLLIQGSQWGAPEAGTTIIQDVLSENISTEALADAVSVADAALDLDNDWYDDSVTGQWAVERPTIVDLLATLSISEDALV